MANITATQRLKSDFVRLCKDPVPYITAVPLPSNILEWRYVVHGPENSPYEGGYYHGRLIFPSAYPFKPPSIYIITPNGRFKCNTRLCLSISDFHPDTWNPAWSVSTILTGLLSFMLENQSTLGSIETSTATKKRLALESLKFNLNDQTFCELFPEITEEITEQVRELEKAKEQKVEIRKEPIPTTTFFGASKGTIFNIVVILGFSVLAWTATQIVTLANNEGNA